ncbi:hypothetical protein LUX12_21590 [Streptomyces somaliensis]|uniref:hypothetical protein n=1 Tax=Streptomyces somaliensis TaxID=78355 RepID=UPI0020CDB4A4|nr:hypothetical protein [Streptomyces somaliensis]MCP9946803.1 hypothetical protein [Streptomyces somaliensis]MCP9963436.1 hypothetical protein [Streptomyces somaliensis]
MRILRTLSVAVAGALLFSGAFATATSAEAATTDTESTATANVTVITEVQNAMDYPVWLYIGENNSWFGPIDAHSTKTSDIRVPWVGSSDEMSKSIRAYKDGITCPPGEPCRPHKFHLYYVFQDYWQPDDQVKYTGYGIYDYAQPVPGNSTGGGNKRLVIGSHQPHM